jgi:hypothetical protein
MPTVSRNVFENRVFLPAGLYFGEAFAFSIKGERGWDERAIDISS